MKKTVRSLLMAVLLLCLGAAVLTACGDQETPPPAEKVTVTYVLGDHAKGGVEAPKQADVDKGSQITLAAAPEAAEGWEFDGWQVGSDTALKQPNTKVTVNENVTITAKWKEKTVTPPAEKVTVTYVLGDHAKGGVEAPKQADVDKGSQITLAAAPEAAEGWEFDGWQVGSDTALKQPDTKVTVNENVTITAKWKEKTVTPPAEKVKVTYNLGDHAKDGAVVPTQDDVEKDTQITLPQEDPEAATGYKFIGWKVNDETTLKQKGEEVTISAATTITAQWQFILDGVWKDTVSAEPLGGEGTMDVEFTIQGVEGEDFNAYFIFDIVADGMEMNFFTTIKVEGEELRVVMILMEQAPATLSIDNEGKLKLSISVEDDDPSVVQTITVPRVSDVPAASKMAEGTYYAYEDISCYTVFTVDGDTLTDDEGTAFTMKYVGAHVLLFNSPAQEDVPDYFVLMKKTNGYYCFMGDDGLDILTDVPVKVTFDLGTGSLQTEVNKNGYRQGTTLDDIAALGFNPPSDTVFDGWCDDDGDLDGSTVLENGKTYTAKWKSTLPPVEKAHVTYELGDHAAEGAEAPTQDDVDKNTEITLAAAPEAAEGWEFDGWQVGSDPELKQPKDTVTITDTTTITAKWKAIEYTLKFHTEEGDEGQTVTVVGADAVDSQLPQSPTKEYYRFDGWYYNSEKVDASFKPAEHDVREFEINAKWVQVEALPSENQAPSVEKPITLDYRNTEWSNLTPGWVGKIKPGQVVTLKGTLALQDGAEKQNFYAPSLYLYSGLTPISYIRTDNYVSGNNGAWTWNGSAFDMGNGLNIWGQSAPEYDDTYFDLITDGNVAISFDWSYSNLIALTIVMSKDNGTSRQMLYYVVPAAGSFASEYSIGIGGDHTCITLTEKSSEQLQPVYSAEEETLTLGTTDNNTGYTPVMYTSKIEKGQKIVFSGTHTSLAAAEVAGNWNALVVSLYSGMYHFTTMRADNFIVAGGVDKLVTVNCDVYNLAVQMSNTITTEDITATLDGDTNFWASMRNIINNCTLTLTIDWKTSESEIVVSMDFTKGENTYNMTYKYTAVQGALADSYNFSLGVDHCYANFTSIEKS